MSKIVNITALQILDSRGNPTLEVEITTESGAVGRGSVPSGASTGKYEALELRDFDEKKFCGKGVQNAILNILGPIKDIIIGCNVYDQQKIDQLMINLDGTKNKSKLGANAILGVSLATMHTAANSSKLPLYKYLGKDNAYILPIPLINILNGGAHADDSFGFQEIMIVPKKAESFSHALQMSVEVFHTLSKILKNKNLSTNVGAEGGFAPSLKSNEEAIKLLIEAIERAGYNPGEDIYIAIDAASSEFYNEKTQLYTIEKSSNKTLNSEEMVSFWQDWTKKYPICSIEDGLAEDDWTGWQSLTKNLPKVQIVGDDLFVTDRSRLQQGIDISAANAILLKINQVGTISETIDVINLAKKYNLGTIISHRSGETEDTSIADLAVGLGLKQIKTGSVSRTDRTAKYNQLLRIEQQLGKKAVYAGLL